MRDILHVDLNNFFASCEIIANPGLKDKPVAVGGNEEERRGVVLAKNYIAKNKGVKTGMTLYQAKKICPDIVFVDTHFNLYNHYSKMVRNILLRYTDRVEPFSIDESWLDVTHSKIFGTPIEIADKIREDVKRETGLTVSVGVSFCKIFAKLGSDLKKPDATTVISADNFKNIVWNLPVENMLGIGNKTTDKLKKISINTIGDLARADVKYLVEIFGKVGLELYNNANGKDEEEVRLFEDVQPPKSIGNSTTFYKDLTKLDEIELGFTVLCENIVERMIKHSVFSARTLSITVKDIDLKVYSRQKKLTVPTRDSKIFTDLCMDLFNKNFNHITYIRLLGVSVSDFVFEGEPYQMSIFDYEEDSKKKDIDAVMLKIRTKYGHNSIVRGNNLLDKKIAETFSDENKKD